MILALITITIFRKIRVNVTQLQLKLDYNIIDKYSTRYYMQAGEGGQLFSTNITNDGKMVRLDIYTDCHFIHTSTLA